MGEINKKVNYLTFCIFVLFVFFLINGYGRTSNYLASCFMVLVLLIIGTKQSKEDKYILLLFIFYYSFYVFTSILNYQSFYYLLTTSIINTFLVFVPVLLGGYINLKYNFFQKRKLLIAFLFIWFLIVVVSTITFSSSENGGRDFASEHTGGFLGGGYCATYGSSLLSVVFLTYLLKRDNFDFKKKIILLLMTVVSIVHIWATESTITLLATFSGLFLVVLYHFSGNHIVLRRIITSFLILVTVIIILNIRNIGFSLMNYSQRINFELYSKRLYEVGAYLAYGQETWHMGARLYTLTTSINTFFKHPLLGVGYKCGNEYSLLVANGVGQHSELLDSFAQSGIIGGIPFVAIFLLQIKKISKKSKRYITVPFLFTFLLLFSFNPFLSAQTNFVLFILIPLFIDVFDNDSNEIEGSE